MREEMGEVARHFEKVAIGPKIMKAPAVETSSKAILRLNSSGVIKTPEAPPTCTAIGAIAPQS